MHGRLVEAKEVDSYWPIVNTMVAEACERSNGRYRADHIYRFVRNGYWQLWLVIEESGTVKFVGGTEIVVYPTGCKALAWRFGTGDEREKWQNLMQTVLQWAKTNGCTLAEGIFRRGWRRVLPGWNHTHEYLERGL